jgi:hypothetical protein
MQARSFNDVRVDDFRKTAPVVYRFEFTTSLFANFVIKCRAIRTRRGALQLTGVVGAADCSA